MRSINLKGKMSTFGGEDSGMAHTENLSLYWAHHQCDNKPNLFKPRDADLTQGTSHRLKESALYCAIRFNPEDKEQLRDEEFKISNPKTGKYVMCALVDYGPHERTGRVVDISPGAAEAIGVETDDEVIVELEF